MSESLNELAALRSIPYDVVTDVLQKHRDTLFKMVESNLAAGMVSGLTDQIRMDQIDQLDVAIANRKQELKQTADTVRLDWLNNNVFSRENLDFQGKLCKEYWMWVFFAPIGVQGDVRTMLDRARGVKNV